MKRLAASILGVVALALPVCAEPISDAAPAETPGLSQESIGDAMIGDATIGDVIAESPRPDSRAEVGTTGAFLRMLGWTTVVLALGGAALMFLRRFTPAGQLMNAGGLLRVLGRTALSPKHSIYIVRVQNERLLVVGVSGDRMVSLGEITDASAVVSFDHGFERELEGADEWSPGAEGHGENATAVQAIDDHWGDRGRPSELFPYQKEVRKIRQMIKGWRTKVKGADPR